MGCFGKYGTGCQFLRFSLALVKVSFTLSTFPKKAETIGPLVRWFLKGWEEDNISQQIDEKKHKIFVFLKVRSRLLERVVYLVIFLKAG